jgi:hypothetical protein
MVLFGRNPWSLLFQTDDCEGLPSCCGALVLNARILKRICEIIMVPEKHKIGTREILCLMQEPAVINLACTVTHYEVRVTTIQGKCNALLASK